MKLSDEQKAAFLGLSLEAQTALRALKVAETAHHKFLAQEAVEFAVGPVKAMHNREFASERDVADYNALSAEEKDSRVALRQKIEAEKGVLAYRASLRESRNHSKWFQMLSVATILQSKSIKMRMINKIVETTSVRLLQEHEEYLEALRNQDWPEEVRNLGGRPSEVTWDTERAKNILEFYYKSDEILKGLKPKYMVIFHNWQKERKKDRTLDDAEEARFFAQFKEGVRVDKEVKRLVREHEIKNERITALESLIEDLDEFPDP